MVYLKNIFLWNQLPIYVKDMNEIKNADVTLLNFCNFSCDYCIANSEKHPLHLNEDGTIKIHDLRYNGLGYKNPFTARQNGVPFENEAFNKTIEGIAHPRGHFLDFKAFLRFARKYLSDWTITITGGEPLYYPKVDDFLKELNTTNKIVLLTNLSLIKGHKNILTDIPKDRIYYRVGFHPEQRNIDSFKSNVDVLVTHDVNFVVNYILHPQHIENGSYQSYIDMLNESGYPYEITRYEGIYKGEKYSCHEPMKDWEQIIIGEPSDHLLNIPSNTPGSAFMLIQADGEIFECAGKGLRLGNVYENKLHLHPVNKPKCFSRTNTCPSIKSTMDIHNRLNHHRS